MKKSPVNRRQILTGLSATLGGMAGCSTILNSSENWPKTVSLLSAGSLSNALENGLSLTLDTSLEIEAHGSTQVAQVVAEGQKNPDIVTVADVGLFDSPLHPNWYAEFATNSIVIAYNPATDGGKRLAEVGSKRWYQVLMDDNISLGRTDPDLDPLGYRTLFMLELATDFYDTKTDLRDTIPRKNQIYPETQLISQFETGSIDVAIAYRNMAVERGYEYIELPGEIDLSEPHFIDEYSSATYKLPNGKVVRGGLISYGSTIRQQSSAIVDVFKHQITGQYLHEFGFVVPDNYPRYTGNVPNAIVH